MSERASTTYVTCHTYFILQVLPGRFLKVVPICLDAHLIFVDCVLWNDCAYLFILILEAADLLIRCRMNLISRNQLLAIT